MIILLGCLIVWVIGGTETYRRLGALEIARAYKVMSSQRHVYNCDTVIYKNYSHPCDCTFERNSNAHLVLTAFQAYTSWPLYLIGYAIINGCKLYKNLRGEDYSFFVKPKMVKSQSERMKSIEEKTAAAHKAIDDIDKEMAKL